ncbi:putative O-GlcNAcase [Selenomonas ruminantium subsp. lactilytica TAM6421]|uniref:Putative O-GlcNAcase n=1 Tax=Selenomonas ruminantium subsp. lactilytica (strain NBRC 103574 / TAM6421) TaxID=927704 RepID=I0GP72_SELRL|nr:protein O-GlcNAcase [Selenomonas ruminantium]BAL82559.1 putative O-GlcNAcase [Selenomonas ruminantium subsp. lactilytica TAM6421]
MRFLRGKWKYLLGVFTLAMLTLWGNVPASSAPAIPLRGIVEGFYGTPWSQADRLDMLQFCHDHKLNAYIYAPKDDPYHRAKWREPYPADKMAELRVLIDASKKQQVKFIFAISPGLDIHFDGPEGDADKIAMERKLTAMYEMGVRDFAIFFDDIKNKDAKGQAEFLNWLNENFIAKHKDVAPLITVPTEYFRQDMEAEGQIKEYTRDFSATLDKNILVLYTGEKVVPDGLTDEDYAKANKLYGRQLGVWWNYPVSDYLEAKLALGPIEKMPVKSEIPAIFYNPMKHAELSKISLATGADYARNPSKYDAVKSWQKAIKSQYGKLAPAMEAFADHNQHMVVSWAVIGPEDGAAMRQLMEAYWQDKSKGEKLTADLSKLDQSISQLQQKLPAKALQECQPQLQQLQRIVRADMLGIRILAGEQDKRAEFDTLLAEVKAHDKEAQASEKTCRAFLDKLAGLL